MNLRGCARREGVQMRPQPAAPTWAGEGAAAGGARAGRWVLPLSRAIVTAQQQVQVIESIYAVANPSCFGSSIVRSDGVSV